MCKFVCVYSKGVCVWMCLAKNRDIQYCNVSVCELIVRLVYLLCVHFNVCKCVCVYGCVCVCVCGTTSRVNEKWVCVIVLPKSVCLYELNIKSVCSCVTAVQM